MKHEMDMGMAKGDKSDGMKMPAEMEEYMKKCEVKQKQMGGDVSHTTK